MQVQEYDYVVVGAGSAGCIIAGELSADPALRVLVARGGAAAEDNPETLEAAGYKKAFINDALMHDRYSEPQAECASHRLFMGSGRGVGGSGAINAMVYTRGGKLDFESWERRLALERRGAGVRSARAPARRQSQGADALDRGLHRRRRAGRVPPQGRSQRRQLCAAISATSG